MDHRTSRRKIGDLGEDIACNFLQKRGFEVVERNYLRKWGEIDIVARKANVIHFIEVKSVSCVTAKDNPLHDSQETYRPEDNMHPRKIGRLIRTMQTYIMEKGLDQGFQLDLITVKINMDTRKARVEIIENVGI